MTAAAAPDVCAPESDLLAQAQAHLSRNGAALGQSFDLPPLDFVIGRDGSMTARREGAWISGCSVPRRAAELMLRTLSVRGNLACLAGPTHAHQVAVCLERMESSAGLIVLLNDPVTLVEILSCVDFSPEIEAGRLFFAVGMDELRALFDRNPGLPVPQQFVKVASTAGEVVDALMRDAQSVYSDVARVQQERLGRVHVSAPARREGSLALLAPTAFKLWNDAGHALRNLLDGTLIDPDDPRQSAIAYIAEIAAQHAGFVTVDIARSDRPELARIDQPWITWITQPRVPVYLPASRRDGVVLCDASLRPAAQRAGWPADRIAVAPLGGEAIESRTASKGDRIAIICDLPDLTPPAAIREYSSWRLVWEAIQCELAEAPARLGADPAGYLDRMLARQNVTDRNVPKALFLEHLIAPAFAIGVARLLVRENIPVALHGRGWKCVARLGDFAHGPVRTRVAFNAALAQAAGVVDTFVTHPVHPVRTIGRPVIRALGATTQRILQDARSALSGATPAVAAPSETLADAVARLLA